MCGLVRSCRPPPRPRPRLPTPPPGRSAPPFHPTRQQDLEVRFDDLPRLLDLRRRWLDYFRRCVDSPLMSGNPQVADELLWLCLDCAAPEETLELCELQGELFRSRGDVEALRGLEAAYRTT